MGQGMGYNHVTILSVNTMLICLLVVVLTDTPLQGADLSSPVATTAKGQDQRPSRVTSQREAVPLYLSFQHQNDGDYLDFRSFLNRNQNVPGVYHHNFDERLHIRIQDVQEQPLANVPFRLINQEGRVLWQAQTHPDGESVIYPNLIFGRQPHEQLFVEIKENTYPVSEEILSGRGHGITRGPRQESTKTTARFASQCLS